MSLTTHARLVVFLIACASLALAAAWPAAAQTRTAPRSRAEIQSSFAPVVRSAAPAVVNIYTGRNIAPWMMTDPSFRQFFAEQAPRRVQNSLGSGVIVDPSGIVVTNNHVIAKADEIKVILADRREFEAKVLRADERTDLAVLKIEAPGGRLPALEFADSDDIEVGDLVLAIGNPFGVGQTVTLGIVSALARTQVGIADYRFFIQTDAAINPGNSGGALIGADGRLIGINTAIYNREGGGGSLGIGFAIPSNMVRSVVSGAGAGQRLVRPWFGVSGDSVAADRAASLGLARPIGVFVRETHDASPAERAGIRRGDVVLSIDGREVQDLEALRFRIATHAVGQTVAVGLLRDGRERVVSVTLVAPPEIPPRDLTALRGDQPLSGAVVANLSPALADELMLETEARGVVVVDVRRASPAQRLGLQPGDILMRLNDREVRSTEDARRLASLALPWRLQLRRGERVFQVVVSR
ncbi:MAG: Do family serine endopeptidase [Rhodospirillales bacterium]